MHRRTILPTTCAQAVKNMLSELGRSADTQQMVKNELLNNANEAQLSTHSTLGLHTAFSVVSTRAKVEITEMLRALSPQYTGLTITTTSYI